MKYPLSICCPKCGKPSTRRMHVRDDAPGRFDCPQCGHCHEGFFGLDVTVGVKILWRGQYEVLVEQDYDMAIVLAAVAMDSEMSFLYRKWRMIEVGLRGDHVSEDRIQDELRRFGVVARKIEKVSALLVVGGIERFVADWPAWRARLAEGCPSSGAVSVVEKFERGLFWPRNRVLHEGYCRHSRADALRCCELSQLGIWVFKEMDRAKLRTMGI